MHSKLAPELDRGLQRAKSGVGIPISRRTEAQSKPLEATRQVSGYPGKRAQISDMKINVSCPIHLPTPPPSSLFCLAALWTYHTGKGSNNVKTLATVSWENHLGGMLRFQSPRLPGSPPVSERSGTGSDGINSFRDPWHPFCLVSPSPLGEKKIKMHLKVM